MLKKDATNYIVGGVVLIIIILLGWLLVTRKHAATQMGVDTTAKSETSGMAAGGGSGSVTVADQAAGASVKVTAMELSKSSWIAIKEISSGRILGAGWFPAGATSGTVELLRATTAGGKYEAVVYEDNGDKKFDMKQNILVEGVSSDFSAQ